MANKEHGKLGIYNITEQTVGGKKVYVAENDKIIYSKRFKKWYPNKGYTRKEFSSMAALKKFVNAGIKKYVAKKNKVLKTLNKTLYLVLFDEILTGRQFVKVGFTTKKFVARRFATEYGYKDYKINKIIRKVSHVDADKMEDRVKREFTKKRNIKKYRPAMRDFSGYSECYDFACYDDIVKVFDDTVKKFLES